MQNGMVTMKDSLAVSYKTRPTLNIWSSSYKTKHILYIWSGSYTPWYLSKGAENLYPHKNLHRDVYSNSIHNCQNLKQPRCPLKGMDK